jgi:hypothetical protein
MFGGAIDVPLPITTFSYSAMVDVVAQPVELVVTHPDQREKAARKPTAVSSPAHEAGRTVRSPRFSGHEGV